MPSTPPAAYVSPAGRAPLLAPRPLRPLLVLAAVFALLLLPQAPLAALAPAASAAGGPTVKLSASQAGAGGSVTVTGTGWQPGAVLMLIVCGRATPARGVVGGTNSCANADGRAVTADARGAFSRRLPVAEPPVPCPCVVHVATATGPAADADAVLRVAGHPVAALPAEPSTGRLSVLTDVRLDGSSGLLTWFGAPPSRTLVLTVGNAGPTAVKDPVFRVGTAHGVFAPQWDEQQWHGTVAPGGRARIALPVELAAGAHGDYDISLEYGGKVLAEQPWGVGRPWGVTLFWILLCVVVPAAVFRAGMAVVDRVRGGRVRDGRVRPRRSAGQGRRTPRLPGWPRSPRLRIPGSGGAPAEDTPPPSPALPWFTPGSGPGAAGRLSAPHDAGPDHPASPPSSSSPTTPTRKGPM
ncbi:neocarzinostatin apoprotein domain-containing protein [Streptomyces sp. NPDC047000]|uniref:neocarzinostatin apoprotein domain-containing protein n=1 Tax=Streptomyces sp. NPDC047000 TaxID=3155474 RepID=UPI0033C1DACF